MITAGGLVVWRVEKARRAAEVAPAPVQLQEHTASPALEGAAK